MTDYCVFDIETAKRTDEIMRELHLKSVKEIFGFPHRLGFALGVCYESKSKEYLLFDDAKEMADFLLKYKGLIVSFNGKRFDLPVLLPYIDIDVFFALQAKLHLDILEHFYEGVGRKFRVGLNNIAMATLGHGKSGSGADAPTLFQQGKMRELFEYCKQDVLITKDIFEFGIEKAHIRYLDTLTNQTAHLVVTYKEILEDGI